MSKKPTIFFCYAEGDYERIINYYWKLKNEGFIPWVDKRDIMPGEKWENKIYNVIRKSDFFLAFLSYLSVKKRGFLQKELKNALSVWEEKLESDIYLIPVRIDNCIVPDMLNSFQRVDLFEDDGWQKLIKSLNYASKNLLSLSHQQKIEYITNEIKSSRINSNTFKYILSIGSTYYKDKRLHDFVIDQLKMRHDPSERYWLYIILGRIGNENSIPFLKNKSHNENPFVKLGIKKAIELIEEEGIIHEE